MKVKFFFRLKALRCIYASSLGIFKEYLSLLYKNFSLAPFRLCLSQMVCFS